MLGVPKNKVVLLPYSDKWADEYQKVKELFMEMFVDEIVSGENEISLQHIHCYQSNDLTLFYEQIQFRDFLRTHPKYAKEYEDLKKSLSERYFADRKKYTAGKQAFFDKIKNLVAQNPI